MLEFIVVVEAAAIVYLVARVREMEEYATILVRYLFENGLTQDLHSWLEGKWEKNKK